MTNRIREFRNKNGLSQSQFVHEFNEFLNNKKLKSITIPTFSRWENSINSPTETMWKYLSNVMKVPTLMLKGAYSQKEILEVLKNSYISESKKSSLSYSEKISEVSFNVDLICIAQGLLPYDEPRFNLLSEKEINNIDFWNENFSFIFNSIAVKWLITKPLDATKEDIVDALRDALATKLLKLERDDKDQKDSKQWIEPPKELLQKRQDFINEHIFIDEDEEPFIDFSKTNY
ncbi:DNA-binding transcriptional regulator [uncultured Lactobacillus sp.]|uniref:helix-turn-helix domain-containing protein n=1 Tax=uncultured Lactobacillus sp. TaxID=153152 RepID=UPI0025D9B4EA|nr:helix-turn-helix transcriptional regulator [uncultured Lactobacillus sp.]